MTRACTRTRLIASVLFASLVAEVHSLGQQPAPMQTPPFRAGINLVTVDFFVVANDGSPIPDLKSEEVTLKVNGRGRPIRSLEWIQVANAASAESAPAAAPSLPPAFGTNVIDLAAGPDRGRTFILVLDDDSFRPGRERPLRDAVGRFLTGLSRRDRISLVTMPYGGLKVDFTTEHDRVRQALSQIVGQAQQGESGSDAACRTRRTLESLTGLLGSLGGGEGPTTVLFVSAGLAGPRRDAPVTLAPGACELTTEHFQQVTVAASAARAHFYVIQPEDVMLQPGAATTENIAGAGFRGSDNQLEGLEHLAGVTGGRRLHLGTAGENTLNRVARETSGYYLVAFDAQPSDRAGTSHRIELGVARGNVTIHARPEFTIPRADSRALKPPPTTTPRNMLRDSKTFRDLPLRAAGFASQNPGDGKLKIVAIAEPTDPSVKLSAAAAGVFDAKGQLAAQWTANAEDLNRTPIMMGLIVSPGIYRLRFAATDPSGRSGSADYEIVAELVPAGPLKLSSIVLGLSRGGTFMPRLQFASEPVAMAFIEMYGRPSAPVTVTIELATTLNGPALVTVPGAVAETSDPERHVATVAIPIGALPVGDFAVRAIVGVQGQPAGRVVRTLRKTTP